MKNDTVIGIIGKTQGVSRAASPHSMASTMAAHSDPPVSWADEAAGRSALSCPSGSAEAAASALSVRSSVGESAFGDGLPSEKVSLCEEEVCPSAVSFAGLPRASDVCRTSGSGFVAVRADSSAPGTPAVCPAEAPRIVNVRVRSSGGRQLPSSQAIHSTVAFSVMSPVFLSRTRWVNTAFEA